MHGPKLLPVPKAAGRRIWKWFLSCVQDKHSMTVSLLVWADMEHCSFYIHVSGQLNTAVTHWKKKRKKTQLLSFGPTLVYTGTTPIGPIIRQENYVMVWQWQGIHHGKLVFVFFTICWLIFCNFFGKKIFKCINGWKIMEYSDSILNVYSFLLYE